MKKVDVLIIGASASGLMCAIEAGKRGRSVLILDHANKAGKKILMSGGGRCNFTNYDISADNYLSQNPHFCKSALSRFTQWDFLAMIDKHKIPFHERSHGELFCNDSAKDILNMLLAECSEQGVKIKLNIEISKIERDSDDTFQIKTGQGEFVCDSLVVACGGLSIPKMCASPLGYQIAEQFDLNIIPTFAGLVPFTLQPQDKTRFSTLSGIAINSVVNFEGMRFRENILFTHRGISGPAILQISSYWRPGNEVDIDLLPDLNLVDLLNAAKDEMPKRQLNTVLIQYLPKRLIGVFIEDELLINPMQTLSKAQIEAVASALHQWKIKPNGTEGYRTAEVTVGGVDCDEISSKTFESEKITGLYFIGEILDVTGWLGGYNFQWSWASGYCAGLHV